MRWGAILRDDHSMAILVIGGHALAKSGPYGMSLLHLAGYAFSLLS